MYLPNASQQEARFTPAECADLRTALAILEEKWQLFYPRVAWRQIDFLPSAATQPAGSEATLVGTGAGTTRMDDLYGESIPVDGSGNFVQPHGNASVDAIVNRVFKSPVTMEIHVLREETDNELTQEGANMARELTATLLCSLCDHWGIVVNVGDEFDFAGQVWEVKQASIPARARWKWTNIPLYIVCKCQAKRLGS